jgi:hypothetical protein
MRSNTCTSVLAVCLAVFPVSQGLAQHCNPNWTAEYKCMQHCGPCPTNNNTNSNYDNGAAAAADAAAADAAAARRQRDAELEQKRIDAENQRRAEEAEKRAKFDQDKREALGQLKGIANGDGFDSASGLKGLGSIDSNGLKTSPDVKTDTSVVDLSDTNLADANKALMKHQWAMSIDRRYKDDPEVQQYIRNLWKDAARSNDDPAMSHLRSILTDQFKVAGLTEQQIQGFFQTFDTFITGLGPIPTAWDSTSKFAHDIDAAAPIDKSLRSYKQILVNTLGRSESVKAGVLYMGTGPQTTDDCVLHAISDGAQVPYAQVKARLEPTLKNLSVARIEVRNHPELAVTSQKQGGVGGLNPFEEILIARQVGNVVGVPDKNFAKAIESTGRPVITSVRIDAYDANGQLHDIGNHEVAVTGVYRTPDGKIYYSVMDSNLKSNPNYTAYIEKNEFEDHMLFGGGYVVVKNGTN